MEVVVVDAGRQDFNGAKYYRSGKYFGRVVKSAETKCGYQSERLHRAVWEFHNGPIPADMHIHHINENRDDNRLENLQMMPKAEHLSMHSRKPEVRERQRKWINSIRHLASAWHKSDAGRKWHSKIARNRAPISEETRKRMSESGARASQKPELVEARRNLMAKRKRDALGRILPATGE